MKPYAIDRVSVVIPVYNEEASLPELLRRTCAACRLLDCQVEIILVDDGSRDRSAELLQQAASEPDSPVVAVLLNRNYGQHSAILAGFEQARGDLIITLDADLQNPPEEIPRLVHTAAQGYDVVGTVRQQRQDSYLRTLPSRLINRAVQRSTGVAMRDYGCMLRAYRRQVVQSMLACHERSTFIPILANTPRPTTHETSGPRRARTRGFQVRLPQADQPDVRPADLHDHHPAAHAQPVRRWPGHLRFPLRRAAAGAARHPRRRVGGRWRVLAVRRAVHLYRRPVRRPRSARRVPRPGVPRRPCPAPVPRGTSDPRRHPFSFAAPLRQVQ